MKLGTLLLRNAAIGLSQLEAALRNQVLYGGRLGTNLVELGHLDLEQLSAYLAELSGHPIASQTLLDQVSPALLEQLGAEDAHRLRAIPLGYLGEGRSQVAVGFVDPEDREAVAEVAAKLGAAITPYVVPELRAVYYLERLFGLPRRARFVRTSRTTTEAAREAERRRSQPAGGLVAPPPVRVEPRRRRPTTGAPGPTEIPVSLSLAAAGAQIDAAATREQIAETFARYAEGRWDAVAVFLVRDGHALGWRSWVAYPIAPRPPIEALSLPLGGASSFQVAHDTGKPFVGPPPSAARPVERQLWAALATPDPFAVAVVPVAVKQRTVNLVYAHLTSSAPPAQMVGELAELAQRAQAAYLRLIRHARGG